MCIYLPRWEVFVLGRVPEARRERERIPIPSLLRQTYAPYISVPTDTRRAIPQIDFGLREIWRLDDFHIFDNLYICKQVNFSEVIHIDGCFVDDVL